MKTSLAARRLVVPLLACCTLLAACDGRKNAAATQTAAKVNSEEISIHQVNYVLQRQVGLSPDQIDSASRQTLEALVDQQLALQAAVELRIDRDPAVVQAVEASRRELIARAYAERLAQDVPPPSASDVRKYYDKHPALFAKRRLYTVVDTAVVATPAQQKVLQGQLPGTRHAADVATLLRQSALRFGTRQSTLGAESLPLQAVDSMAALRVGQSHLVAGPRDAHILTIVAIEPAPLSDDEARASIESYLTGEHRRRLVQQRLKDLRAAARIEYQGRFAPVAKANDKAAVKTVPETEAALTDVALRKGKAALTPTPSANP